MISLAALASGLIFGLGLILGNGDPDKVLSFLDITGAWDPSLALVMAGAIAVGSGLLPWQGGSRRVIWGPDDLAKLAGH